VIGWKTGAGTAIFESAKMAVNGGAQLLQFIGAETVVGGMKELKAGVGAGRGGAGGM